MKKKVKKEEDFNPYCPTCGTCGFIGCCGIREFLLKHVKGKTNCTNESLILNDLITEINEILPREMQQEYLEKCPKHKNYKCSGWHQVYSKTNKTL